ncbi:MAG: AAA family ATPase, partial [Gaiellaceae bacterium]
MLVCTQCGHENREGARFCDACGAPTAAPVAVREQRKTVTVLFCDVTGSTALGERLDPETLRALLARYFDRMSAIVGGHGGTVEKFIGDAVMAVFGVPVLHEDDALRAVRAAVEMRDAFPALGIEGRIGVMTGEVVTGTEERLATGDAVNVAARLEQAAQPGEVLIGASTLALVREAVEVEQVEPLSLKGKAQAVPAYRLLAVLAQTERDQGAAMVGRGDEFDLLRRAWERSCRDQASQLFTVLGAAGVGKSRLAAEFLSGLEATVVRGRCLSYGEGITYWPVVEVLKQLGTRPENEQAAAVVAGLLGERAEPTTADEIAWAFRKTLEEAATEQPLVCVFDDLHWAEPALLDLVEHVADASREAPILLLCMGRPELLDRRPGWAGGKMNATSVLLEPLSPAETDQLIEALLDDVVMVADLRGRIREAAEGNPLFVEEMLAMVRASTDGQVVVPPTIQALLAARLDQLDPSERAVLEHGSVEGKIFHRGAVEALTPDESRVPTRLMALVRKELVRPNRTQLVGDDAFRFRHLLIRDAAYDGLPKSVRADLHERFATWLEAGGTELVELDEILGYHLEQACRYRFELGTLEDPALAAKARSRLAAGGRRALLRQDLGAAISLLERAATLLAPGEVDTGLAIDRIDTLFFAGRAEDA